MAEDRIHLQIVTAAGVGFDAQVSYVGLPLVDGSIGVLENHAPVLAAVAAGTVVYIRDGERQQIPVGEGIVEIHDNQVVMLTQPVRQTDEENNT